MKKIKILVISLFVTSLTLAMKLEDETLRKAAFAGDIELAKKALKKGANVNAAGPLGFTALTMATMRDRFEMVQFLLDNDADVDQAITNGNTPLMIATWNGYSRIVQLLLDRGADIYAQNIWGETALNRLQPNNPVTVKIIEDFIAKRKEEVSQAILEGRPETYPAIAEEIAEFEIGK